MVVIIASRPENIFGNIIRPLGVRCGDGPRRSAAVNLGSTAGGQRGSGDKIHIFRADVIECYPKVDPKNA